MANPILVEVTRGEGVESLHRGAACVIDATGKVIHAWGDVDALVCPRSAIKPIQTLVLLESGAADAFGVSDAEVALSCASHSGELGHTTAVAAWLKRIGLSVKDLECGAHAPSNEKSEAALIKAGEAPTALHNNCSGKHTGFLAAALHMNVPTRGYTSPAHAVQRAVMVTLSAMTGFDAAKAKTVTDGCSAPNLYMPLKSLATGWARLAAPAPGSGNRADAAQRIINSMKANPFMVAGSERPGTRLITAMKGQGIAKVGAEGVYAACLPEQGLGIALKIDDGALRASQVAMAAILKHLGAFRADASTTVADLFETPITAWAGTQTGVVRAAKSWLT